MATQLAMERTTRRPQIMMPEGVALLNPKERPEARGSKGMA